MRSHTVQQFKSSNITPVLYTYTYVYISYPTSALLIFSEGRCTLV